VATVSINFELLRPDRPELATLGAYAEQYAYADPASALVKLRTFGEQLTKGIYWELRLPKPESTEFASLLTAREFRAAVPAAIANKLHAIRKEGNRAAHGKPAETKIVLWLIQEAYEIGAWFFVRCLGKPVASVPKFQDVPDIRQQMASKAELDVALAKLADQEQALADAVAERDKARTDYAALEGKADELAKLAEQGQKVVDALHINEATTRQRLIDVALTDAGWNVGANGTNTDEVTQEEEVGGQPTPSGNGNVDYVLWDDNGKPLAVVEVKKTSVSAELGKKQASLYADDLERRYGQRPVIFYTNGYDITIWDDAQGYPPRPLFGFYSKDSLQYLVDFQRATKKPLNTVAAGPEIAGRLYQIEAIRRVTERFTAMHRRALIVQATGTGKTRVAIALTDLLIRANWVKRVLFLCDRRELRKQAKNAYGDFLTEPLTIVSRRTAKDRDKRIYLATYPSMMDVFHTFDVGFFDLIIADESHRSVYNVYGDLFRYFDALQVGLTATPVEFIARNTFRLFGCNAQDPTAYYPLERAVEEGFLVPYEVYTHTTRFLRQGIKYEQMSEEQRRQIEEDGIDPLELNHEAAAIDAQVFNKDTNRAILRNLMENGIRDGDGQNPGKTIIFARGHGHAVLMQKLFDEMYPQFGGTFCQVIDTYDPRAEQLIDDFKGEGSNPDLTIAISVDMLDTGIDVPEIVNLVFAKPVKSKVKFWQMIGRGTRLCPDLFGPGRDKTHFRIFDHWGNFEYFDQPRPEAEPSVSKSLMQRVFEARISLGETALRQARADVFKIAAGLLVGDVASLPDDTISVKEHWREVQTVAQDGAIEGFAPGIVNTLRFAIAPLMQWVQIRGHSDAYHLDLLIAEMQVALLNRSNRFDDCRGEFLNRIASLRMNLNPVKEKAATIRRVRSGEFWGAVTPFDLEDVRKELRSIMQHKDGSGIQPAPPKVYDIAEDPAEFQYGPRPSRVRSIDQAAYRRRVEEALTDLFDTEPTLRKIRMGQPVTQADLQALTSLVLTQHPDVDLSVLEEFYPAMAGQLDGIIRTIVGMQPEAVQERFTRFVHRHPGLTAKQVQFIALLQNHIARNGRIEIDRLFEPPFTSIDSDGLDGVFSDEGQITELLDIICSFDPANTAKDPRAP